MKITKSSLKQFDFTPFDSTALFPKIKFILGDICQFLLWLRTLIRSIFLLLLKLF